MVNAGETIPKTPISGEMNKYYPLVNIPKAIESGH